MSCKHRTINILLCGLLMVCFFILISFEQPVSAAVSLKRVSFPKTKSVYSGTSATFKVKASGVKSSKICWKSSNSKVVKLTRKKGKSCRVKFLKGGNATVSCYIKGRKKKTLIRCRVKVTVCKTKLKSAGFDKKTVHLYIGDIYRNKLALNPKNAVVKDQVRFSSSKKSVASVGADGTVYAKNAGTAVIRAKAIDGSGISKKYKVVVHNFLLGQKH